MTVTPSHYRFHYQPLYKPNQLICGYGQTAVVTGWTVRQSVAKHLKPEEYAAIGNLYSPTRGVSPLLRNLLANPHVQFLVVINATKEDKNAGGCQCLLDFFRQGFTKGKSDTGRDCWVINSSITGYIDIEIPSDALLALRENLQCTEARSLADAIHQIKEYAQRASIDPWGSPLTFPQLEVMPNVLPGRRYGHRIEGKTIAETWVKILHRIKTTGVIRCTSYGQWQELINLMAIVTHEPKDFYFPEPNYLPVKPEFIQSYISQVLDDSIEQEGTKYTYGQRLRSWFGRDQIEQAIQKLVIEKDSSRAVMSLWDVRDYEENDSPPCLNHIWLRIVDNELSLTATFRSNDMFSAWVANAMGLRALQQHIQDEIAKRSKCALKIGPLITISQSAHIYDDTWENVDRLIARQYVAICRQRDYYDPVGNFLIEIEEEKIIVKQMTPGSGEIVACYTGNNPLKLVREICVASPAIQPDHIGYLGIELQKAYECLKNARQYVQDRQV